MLGIETIYGHGFDKANLPLMETVGFVMSPKVGRYDGSQTCRYIDFETGPCLELIEVTNEEDYFEFVPRGMKPYWPGMSIELPKDSEKSLADYAEEFHKLRPYTLHMNYDGSSNPGKPGWNYLNFEIPLIPDMFTWLTKMDEPRPARTSCQSHPNTVRCLLGAVFDLESENLKTLSDLVGKDMVDGAIEIGGFKVWSRSVMADFPVRGNMISSMRAVVLKAKTLRHFEESIKGVRRIPFMSHPAAYVETNPLSWDLVIAEI